MKKRKRIPIIMLIILLIFISVIYYIPKKMDKSYESVMYRLGDNSYSETMKITLHGYYAKGLFRGDHFTGTITINDKLLEKVNFRLNKNGSAVIMYYDKSTGDYISYGTLYTIDKLNELTLAVSESTSNNTKTWSTKNGLMISAPATNREEALKISNRIINHSIPKITLK